MLALPYSEWGYPEYKRILAGIVASPTSEMQSAMCEAFQSVLSGRPVLPVNRATTALSLALETFKAVRPNRRDVIVPAYICPSVTRAVTNAGLRCVAVDIGSDLNISAARVDQAMSSSTLAVVAAHMYGAPAAIAELEQLCRRKDVFLVDDAAQVLGIDSARRPLGTFGDVGMISFSQSKTIVTGSHNAGGLLVLNNPELQQALHKAWQALPGARNCLPDICRFLWLHKWSPWTWTLRYYATRLLPARAFETKTSPSATKIGNLVASLALEQLRTLPERIRGRQRVMEQYYRLVSRYPRITFPQYAPSRYLTRIMVVIPGQQNMNAIRNKLRSSGVQTRSGYPIYNSNAASLPWMAMALQPKLIELPSHSKMREAEIARVLECLDRSLGDKTPEASSVSAAKPIFVPAAKTPFPVRRGARR